MQAHLLGRLQWGRAVEGAETVQYERPILTHPTLLQWGRAVEGAETQAVTLFAWAKPGLQWGRAVEGAETRVLEDRALGTCVASMGPRR